MKFDSDKAFKAFGITFGIFATPGMIILFLVVPDQFTAVFGARIVTVLLSLACFGAPIVAIIVGLMYGDGKP